MANPTFSIPERAWSWLERPGDCAGGGDCGFSIPERAWSWLEQFLNGDRVSCGIFSIPERAWSWLELRQSLGPSPDLELFNP